jgi:predicted RNA-binding Zn ribbon-like protein
MVWFVKENGNGLRREVEQMEYKGGFLFVSNNLALDFVNTRLVVGDQPQELLDTFGSLLRWFVGASLLAEQDRAEFHGKWQDTPEAAAVLEQATALRERLREEIIRVEANNGIRQKMITELNHLLQEHVMPLQIVPVAEGFAEEFRFTPGVPKDLLGPLVYAAADLFTKFDLRRIHKCQTCVFHFYDTTKNGTRRWCSMNICGNRAKVASYAARQRRSETGGSDRPRR